MNRYGGYGVDMDVDHTDPAGEKMLSASELNLNQVAHHQISFFLVKIRMHAGHSEITLHQLSLQKVHLNQL